MSRYSEISYRILYIFGSSFGELADEEAENYFVFVSEVEYRSMASTISEIEWITYLFHDFRIKFQQPVDLWCDNKTALHIAANPVFHERTKHLEIDCHVVREKYR